MQMYSGFRDWLRQVSFLWEGLCWERWEQCLDHLFRLYVYTKQDVEKKILV